LSDSVCKAILVAQPLWAVRVARSSLEWVARACSLQNRTASPSQGLGIKSGCATRVFRKTSSRCTCARFYRAVSNVFVISQRGRARTSADRYGPLGVVWGRRRKQVGGKIVPAQPSIP
jgi:hypothetical protein